MCRIESGVIQGCSLSGSLFALAMNAFFAITSALVSSCRAGVVGGCADDVGVVFKSLVHLVPLSENFLQHVDLIIYETSSKTTRQDRQRCPKIAPRYFQDAPR